MKTLLIATTALVGVASAVAGPLPAREPPSGHYGLNSNDTFLCDYGAFDVSFSAPSFSQSGLVENWVRAAVPVKGKGETLSAIQVGDSFYSPSGGYPGLSVAIYSSRNNKPFKLLTGAWKAVSRCPSTVSMGPIQLQQGKKYWVVEKTDPMFGSPSIIVPIMEGYKWYYRTTKTHDAKWQSGSSDCSGSTYENCHLHSSGDWEPITGGTPYVKLITNAEQRNSTRAQTGGFLPDHTIMHAPDVRSGGPTPFQYRGWNRGPP